MTRHLLIEQVARQLVGIHQVELRLMLHQRQRVVRHADVRVVAQDVTQTCRHLKRPDVRCIKADNLHTISS